MFATRFALSLLLALAALTAHATETSVPMLVAADVGLASDLAAVCLGGPLVCRRSRRERRARKDAVLLQVHRARVRLEISESDTLQSGDTVFLRAQRTGRRISAQPDGTVHAKWFNRGSWEQFMIERVAGPGAVQSGDMVLLRGKWGKPLTAQNTKVHAKWDHEGSWQKWVIESKTGGSISSGRQVYLKAHTGNRLDADAPDSFGVVQARWNHMGTWQALVIEARDGTVTAGAWAHFHLLNQLRAAGYTCPGGQVFAPNPTPARFDCRLWRAAQLHSQDMREQSYFAHASLSGRSPWDRAAEQGTTANAENIAGGYGEPQQTLDQFKKSDAHCRVMMSPLRTVVGVGYAAGGEWLHYWTQLFGGWSGDMETWCYPQ